MEEVNTYNIPAFKRKRSIDAHEKKLNTTPLRPRKTTRKRPSKTIEEISMDISFDEPIIQEENFIETPRAKEGKAIEMKFCGLCEGYFEKISVAIVELTSPVHQGDQLIFETEQGLFQQEVTSMQIDRKDVSLARSGKSIGLKVLLPPKVGGSVYKII
ncbi:hypothetical protein KJ632_01810 [Patescibacteria group bacterium]|nr:hypothetical protein [Patescibacteria group bacterium]